MDKKSENDTKDDNKDSAVDKINFEELIKEYRVDNVNIFVPYLKEIFRDLSERSEDKSQGLSNITFSKYYEVPGIISQRLFAVFDVDKNGFLDIIEFIEGMVCLFCEGYEHLVKLIFKIYDFDRDQLISKEDVRTVISYIPLNTKGKVSAIQAKFDKETFKDRIESQEELHTLLEKAFVQKEKMNLEEFIRVIENVSSDIFLFVLIFLYENKPFTKTTLQNYKLAKSRLANMSKSPTINSINKLIASPSINSKFSPSIVIARSPVLLKKTLINGMEKNSKKNEKNEKNEILSKLGKKVQQIGDSRNFLLKYVSQHKNSEPNRKENKNTENTFIKMDKENINTLNNLSNESNCTTKQIPVLRKNRQNLKFIEENLDHNKHYFHSESKNNDQNNVINGSEGNKENNNDSNYQITPAVKLKTKIFKESTKDFSDLTNLMNIKEEEEDEIERYEVKCEGYLFKITNTRKLKRLWFKLLYKDLYYYKAPDDTNHKGMHNISGVFINEENTVLYDTRQLFCFSVIYPKKTRFYYVDNESDYHHWLQSLRKATGYKNLTDIYDIGQKLGTGKFGVVRLGIHKETNKKVAIKIMSKMQIGDQDLELVKTEIDILKVCQHPFIIRLFDIFENVNYIYIIMEYCAGGDLFSYLEKRGFRLSERRAAQILHKLCCAVYYLHSYGIAHRDLKPENILMSDNTDNADIRLVDFGLSKIIGPNETSNEPYGTLSYVAPEVLLELPYTKAVDMWSIGVITYLLLSGTLPYDHENSDKEIARQTIYDPVRLPFQIWRKNSLESKQFIEALLQKDPSKRMTITQALEHKWFQKFNMNELRLKSLDFNGSTFKFYTTIEEPVKQD